MRSATLKVARFEIMRQLKKLAFWAATLLIPLLIGGIYLISFISWFFFLITTNYQGYNSCQDY